MHINRSTTFAVAWLALLTSACSDRGHATPDGGVADADIGAELDANANEDEDAGTNPEADGGVVTCPGAITVDVPSVQSGSLAGQVEVAGGSCQIELQMGYPGGACTKPCLEDLDCAGEGVCESFFCRATCGETSDCAPGYACGPEPDHSYCYPACTEDAHCPATGHCELALGWCLPAEICDNGLEENEDGLVDCEDPGCAAKAPCSVAIAAACAGAELAVLGPNLGDTSNGSALFSGACGGDALAHEHVYQFTPGSAGETGELVLTLTGASLQTISLRTTCAAPSSELACASSIPTSLVHQVEGGVPLYIVVDAQFPGAEGAYELQVDFLAD